MKRTIIFGYKWKSQLTYNLYRVGFVYIIGMCCPFKLTCKFWSIHFVFREYTTHWREYILTPCEPVSFRNTCCIHFLFWP